METTRNWIGISLKRKEDFRLLTGQGKYTADISLPGMLHAAVLRSPFAHAEIREIDVSKARQREGVVEVITGEDIRGVLDVVPTLVDLPDRKADHPCLARGKVRYVGEPVAVVVATDRYVAEDALEEIVVEYEPLKVVGSFDDAIKADVRLFEDWPDNVAWRWVLKGGNVEEAFRAADLVVRETFEVQRHTGVPMETRAVLANYEWATGELTIWTSSQGPYRLRYTIAPLLGVPESKIRVICGDVGGAFGIKFHLYPEEFLVPYLAKKLGRPIKWVEDRREHFVSAVHGRGMEFEAQIAVKRDGTILGIKAKLFFEMGAYNETESHAPAWLCTATVPGPYRIDNCLIEGTAVVTNKVPFGAYRGFGANEGNWVRERLIDIAARELGLDPAEVRLKNLIGPGEFPYTSSVGLVYDTGQYPENMKLAMGALGYDRWRKEQERARKEGRYIGIGMACFNDPTLYGTRALAALGVKDGGYVGARVQVERDGKVTVYTAMSAQGQGQETSLAQVCAEELGIDPDRITVVHDDTSMCPPSGYQSGGSRGAGLGGGAVAVAARRVKEKALKIAAHKLEAAEADLVYEDGRVYVKGSPDRVLSLAEVASLAYLAHDLPEGVEPGLEAACILDVSNIAFANGTHMAVVEVDPETFQTKILKYVIAHDCGVVINPAIVDGQVMGGAAQGIGGVLFEELVYDENGQLLTTTFTDYRVPRAGDLPEFTVTHTETPTPLSPIGAKGTGESGAIGPYAAVSGAIEDALTPLGLRVTRLPLTPSRIYSQIKG
ncbi:MAG TPA: xanthine dehydrogenase family protein molybdopterin-binding subunit [Firmicutes bacterium]|nr:xanthine dehydrogenase family protein molybdopterin-binding subunit [Bacillota bacterium]